MWRAASSQLATYGRCPKKALHLHSSWRLTVDVVCTGKTFSTSDVFSGLGDRLDSLRHCQGSLMAVMSATSQDLGRVLRPKRYLTTLIGIYPFLLDEY